jgi:NADPH-dependent 2,4-dienoyl-CoA reductase/sulfur reductase-like enzyme
VLGSGHALDPAARRVVAGGREYSFAKLLLATGADPFFPPIAGLKESGVFALRTVEDALRIRECAASCRTVLVLGGGLLGLELADHLADGQREIRVVEYFDTLLPRQLAPAQGRRLQQLLEARGFRFFSGEHSTRLDRQADELVLVTEAGDEIRAGMAIVSPGSAGNGLAAAAGIPSDKGILVNRYLETGSSGIMPRVTVLNWAADSGGSSSRHGAGPDRRENMVRGNTVTYAIRKWRSSSRYPISTSRRSDPVFHNWMTSPKTIDASSGSCRSPAGSCPGLEKNPEEFGGKIDPAAQVHDPPFPYSTTEGSELYQPGMHDP